MEGNVSVYQVHPVSRVTGEGRACIRSFFFYGFGQELFSSRPQYRMLGTGISRSNRFASAPSSGGGFNAARPGLSVRHLDVDADGC